MAKTRSQVLDDLAGIGHGSTVNKITNINALLVRAGNEFLTDCDPASTKRLAQITLFDGVYDYSDPNSDLKEDKIIDLRPANSIYERDVNINFRKVENEEFDLYKENNTITVEHRDAAKYIRVSKALSGSLLLNSCDDITGIGTWAGEGGGTNVAQDENQKLQGGASVKFDVGASGGAVVNSTMTQVDLTDHDEKSSFFFFLYIPDATLVTNVILRVGNDSSNYWSRTITTPHIGSFRTGWNLIRSDWNGMTETGTVAPATVDYIRVFVTTTAADTDFRLDAVYSKLPHLYDMLYYSKNLYRTTGGVWQETFNTDTDILNLDVTEYPLYHNKLGMVIAQQTQGGEGSFDLAYFTNEYDKLLRKYQSRNPSEAYRRTNTYYR